MRSLSLSIPAAAPTKCFTVLYEDKVPAGFPSPAQNYETKAIDLNEMMVHNPPATFFVKAEGDSMVDVGIFDGDLLVVDFSLDALHGDIVIAKLDENFTVKRLYNKQGKIQLHAQNKAANYPPIIPAPEQQLELMGVVRYAIHTLKK